MTAMTGGADNHPSNSPNADRVSGEGILMGSLRQLRRWVVGLAVAAWRHRDALTVPARWPLLRWIDRPLASLLQLEPRMLSSRAKVTRVPFSGTLRERARSWIWEKHSVRSAVLVSLGVGVGMWLAALTASRILDVPMLGPSHDIDGIPTLIIAAAAYLGGLFGFLQAVTIFAVQIRSQRDTSILPLTPLIARRYFAFFILGAIAGVTIANLVAAFSAPLLPLNRTMLGALTWLNIIAVPGATIAALWYLSTIVSDAGEADMDVALPILRATMRAIARDEAHKLQMINEYEKCLNIAGIEYNRFASVPSGTRPNPSLRIPFGRPGTVIDMDCHRLKRVTKILTSIPSSPKAVTTIAIGQAIQSDNSLILISSMPATPNERSPAAASADGKTRKKLQNKLNSTFIIRRLGTI